MKDNGYRYFGLPNVNISNFDQNIIQKSKYAKNRKPSFVSIPFYCLEKMTGVGVGNVYTQSLAQIVIPLTRKTIK